MKKEERKMGQMKNDIKAAAKQQLCSRYVAATLKNYKKVSVTLFLLFSLLFFTFSFATCTFDYGETEAVGDDQPDLIMENVDYVRVRSKDPIARFRAERAERYENLGVMKLQNFTFEQYGERGEEVNAMGKAGFAEVDINTSDIHMDNGVRIEVATEDIVIDTKQLDWKDESHTLFTGDEDEVNILQDKGTNFVGVGLHADARRRTWEFLGEAGGTYVFDDDDEEAEGEQLEE